MNRQREVKSASVRRGSDVFSIGKLTDFVKKQRLPKQIAKMKMPKYCKVNIAKTKRQNIAKSISPKQNAKILQKSI